MRAVRHSDVAALARVIAVYRKKAAPPQIGQVMDLAHAADKYRKRYRRDHPIWGNGSVFSCAMGHEQHPAQRSDRIAALRIIRQWRARGL